MYYEEQVVNGVLSYRTTPNGKWEPCSLEIITTALVQARERLREAEKQRAELVNEINEH